MVARSIQARVTRRVLAVLTAALALVGVASVGVTAFVLDEADSRAAQVRAASALRALEAERAEGDAPEVAMREVLDDADANGVRLSILTLSDPRDGLAPRVHRPLPFALSTLPAGTCATASDAQGDTLRACALRAGGYEVIAAISIGAHVGVVRTLAMAMLGLVVAALLGVTWAVRRAVAGPTAAVGALARWTEQIDLDRAPPAPPPPASDLEELGRLGASFDGLVQRLIAALTRERAHGAHIAHELRTPLTAIVAELEAMPTTPESAPFVRRVRADVDRLSRVIDAILVLARAPQARSGEGAVNVADLARELACRETTVTAPDEALIEGDAALIQLAIRNLLDNAEKYSGHPAREVRVERLVGEGTEREMMRVTVIDDGPGLDAPAREKMFDRYWRGTSDRGGTGLGLALVRAVAERHGGAASAGDGQMGATGSLDAKKGLAVTMTLGPVVGWHEGERRPSAS